MCTPKILSVFDSAKIFTNPSDSLLTLALELAKNGNLPTLYEVLFSFNCSSVLPTDATSGEVYITPGITS